jgi:HK97 family phage portal protein
MWMMFYGNAYLWQPVSRYREIYLLDASKTYPAFDEDGNLWYRTMFPNGEADELPAVEVCHLMINSANGLVGKSVISYAKETLGRQMGALETQNKIQSNGLNPSAAIWFNGELSKEARTKIKDSYTEGIRGSSNAGGVAVFDNKIAKFETITITPADAQFLETIQATDAEIANFFGMPLYKLNQGKQSYQSNEQQNLDYLRTTLNPYLVQWEQAGRLKWLAEWEMDNTYLRFNRNSLLQTDAKTRAEYLEKRIFSGQMTPNEARAVEDESAYVGGDRHYVPANMVAIEDPVVKV